MNEQKPQPSIFKPQPMPRYRASKENKMAFQAKAMSGEGQYVFENNTKGDLYLPRPTKTGRRTVGFREQFIGDNYYFSMVPGELKYIKEIMSPATEKINEQRLITEQPPTVTRDGTVEHIVPKTLNEGNHGEDILLTETPLDGLKIIR